MVAKHTNVKFFALFFFLFGLLMLTGCANMSTQLDIEGDNFSGTRDMYVIFDMDELLTRLPGGTDDLNAMIDTAIPKQLSYNYDVSDDEVVYKFTLSFDSKQDYIDKLKDLLSKAPEVNFTYSTGVFTRGVTYNENFESRELFTWFDKLVTENGLVTASQNYSSEKFWNQTGVKVILDGEEFTCDGGKVDIQSGGSSVVSNINIATALKASGDIERTISITIPNSVEKSQITLIENYLNDNIPSNGAWSKHNNSGNIVYTVAFTAESSAKLQTYMEKLTNGQCQCTLESVQDLSQPLAESRAFNEYIDFSYFGGENGVSVTYEVTSENDSPYQINLIDDEQEKDSEAEADGDKLACSGKFTAIKFKTVLRKMALVQSIDYNLFQTGKNKFIREIVITLAPDTNNSVILNQISDYYTIKGAGNTQFIFENDEESESGTQSLTIRISGNSNQVMAAEAVLFGGVGARSLNSDRSWGIFSIHPKTTLVDSFDITSLLNVMNVSSYVYTYSCDGDTITQVTCNIGDEQDSREFQNESDIVGFGLSNGIQTITIQGYYFNGWAVFFIVLFIILIIALIAMGILLYLYKTGKIELPINKKKEELPTTTEPLFTPIPTQNTNNIHASEPEPIPIPTLPPRDFTDSFDDEEEEKIPIIMFDSNKEIEPEPEPEAETNQPSASSEPNMEPVLSYPEKYHPDDKLDSHDETKSESVNEPEPSSDPTEPTAEPEPTPRVSPDDYTDADMIEDFDALGLLGEYKKHVQKVKVKVRKLKNEEDGEITTEE